MHSASPIGVLSLSLFFSLPLSFYYIFTLLKREKKINLVSGNEVLVKDDDGAEKSSCRCYSQLACCHQGHWRRRRRCRCLRSGCFQCWSLFLFFSLPSQLTEIDSNEMKKTGCCHVRVDKDIYTHTRIHRDTSMYTLSLNTCYTKIERNNASSFSLAGGCCCCCC